MATATQAPTAPTALASAARWYRRRLALPIFYGASVGSLLTLLTAVVLLFAAPLVLNDGFLQQTLQSIAFYTHRRC